MPFGGRLVWDVTRLTTFTGTGLRTFLPSNPTVGVTGSGYLGSIFTATADHELLRNLLLNISASYENDSFQNTSRTDNVFTAGAGIRYLVNQNLFVGGTYLSTAQLDGSWPFVFAGYSDAAGRHAVLIK